VNRATPSAREHPTVRFWLASAGDEVSEWRHREGDAVTRVCAKKTAEAHAVSGFGSGMSEPEEE
jgi:hypothetical protein